ncbi:MAG TPA: alpha/beta hydrolase, partial [Caulobacteraceae bacterium]|nr:alpha/beta hydrolase [Caulobacteraceae bacterium]
PANPPFILEQTDKALTELRAGRTLDVSGFHPGLQPLFGPQVQPFLISLFSYDPAELVKAYKGPVLVVQGTTDLQITMVDAERLAAARPGVTLVRIEGMNHVLKTAPADRLGNMSTYGDASLPLAPGVADAIATFVKAN